MSTPTIAPPAAAPVAPPASHPTKVDAPSTPAPEPFNDAFAALDKMVGAEPKQEEAPHGEPAKSAEKPSDSPPSAKPADSGSTKPTDNTSAEAKPVKAAELRAAYDQAKKRLADSDRKIAEFERELKTLRDQPKNDAEREELKAKLDAAEKRRSELEDWMRVHEYKQSDEYKATEAKYTEAWKEAIKEISELTVITTSEDGTEDQRPANSQDLINICNLPLGQAMTEAKAKFGELASVVLAHRKTIRDLADAQAKNEAAAKDRSKEWFSKRDSETKAMSERMQAEWKTLNDDAVKKYPQWFAPDESDPEGNKLLEAGFRLADAGMSGQLKPEEAVKVHSAIRNKAAGFDRLVYRLNKANSRITELTKELEAFKSSEPGKGDAEGRKTTVPVSWEDDLERRAK